MAKPGEAKWISEKPRERTEKVGRKLMRNERIGSLEELKWPIIDVGSQIQSGKCFLGEENAAGNSKDQKKEKKNRGIYSHS